MRERRNRPKRTPFQRMGLLILWILAVTALLVGALLLANRKNPDGTKKPSVFSVLSVTAEDSPHYSGADIRAASGIVEGQSVLTLNKKKIANRIIDALAYVESVEVKTGKTFRDIRISVTEQPIFCAVYQDAMWYLVGKDGRILESRAVKSDKPGQYMVVKGTALPESPKIGDAAMTAEEMKSVKKILAAFDQNKIPGLREINITSRSAVSVNWQNRLTVLFGNLSNIDHQVAVLAVTIPRINEKHGWDAGGVVDLRSYADSTTENNYAVFTPNELTTKTTFPLSTATTTTVPTEEEPTKTKKNG